MRQGILLHAGYVTRPHLYAFSNRLNFRLGSLKALSAGTTAITQPRPFVRRTFRYKKERKGMKQKGDAYPPANICYSNGYTNRYTVDVEPYLLRRRSKSQKGFEAKVIQRCGIKRRTICINKCDSCGNNCISQISIHIYTLMR